MLALSLEAEPHIGLRAEEKVVKGAEKVILEAKWGIERVPQLQNHHIYTHAISAA